MKNKPLISHMYIADPSAHVFQNKIFIYPSHDPDIETVENDQGDHFMMVDYHVFSMESIPGKVEDHGIVLKLEDIPWASQQLWAPDAAQKDGSYYFYFPAKDKEGIFRIGVAVSDNPAGPFIPESAPIPGANSIDPCVFTDEDGASYLYWGGLWGGQLEKWRTGNFDSQGKEPEPGSPAVYPKGGKLAPSMKSLESGARDIHILDQEGNPLKVEDEDRRYFEGPWVHNYQGKYYFSYSTGTTHTISYAIGDTPLGPFIYQGVILTPVIGWTTHHSIVEFKGIWYLFYHDSSLSGGVIHKRCIKVQQLKYRADGTIITIDP